MDNYKKYQYVIMFNILNKIMSQVEHQGLVLFIKYNSK
jgi:hypothetical protein